MQSMRFVALEVHRVRYTPCRSGNLEAINTVRCSSVCVSSVAWGHTRPSTLLKGWRAIPYGLDPHNVRQLQYVTCAALPHAERTQSGALLACPPTHPRIRLKSTPSAQCLPIHMDYVGTNAEQPRPSSAARPVSAASVLASTAVALQEGAASRHASDLSPAASLAARLALRS